MRQCEQHEKIWSVAITTDTEEDYDTFIRNNPQSTYYQEAIMRRDRKAQDRILAQKQSIQGWWEASFTGDTLLSKRIYIEQRGSGFATSRNPPAPDEGVQRDPRLPRRIYAPYIDIDIGPSKAPFLEGIYNDGVLRAKFRRESWLDGCYDEVQLEGRLTEDGRSIEGTIRMQGYCRGEPPDKVKSGYFSLVKIKDPRL